MNSKLLAFQKFLFFVVWVCPFFSACSPVLPGSPVPAPQDESGSDVEMEAAFREARDSLDFFIEKIKMPHTGRTYVALKVRFYPPGEMPQDIWLDNVTYSNGTFCGNMGDDIPTLRLSFGEEIVIPTEDIVDWMIVEDGKLIGGYTIRLAYERMSPEEKERFLEAIDYSIED